MQKELFLDSNSHSAMSEIAIKAFVEYNKSTAGKGHPMTPSKPGRKAASALETARGQIAFMLGAKRPGQIIFTSTCTQACEWAMRILHQCTTEPRIKLDKTDKRVFISPVEHPAIRRFEYDHSLLPIDENGVIQECKISKAACIHVQNEIGIIQPLERIKAGYLLSDMCQSVGKVTINLSEMPVDIAVFGGHKFGGSAGVGFIYLRNIEWWTEFGIGSRYFSDRTGTPDVASVVATAAALEEELRTMPERLAKMKEFQSTLESALEELGCEIIAKNAMRVPNTTFIKLPNPRAMEVLLDLSKQGIYVGLGSACGSLHTGDSPLMNALGRSGGAGDFLRFSQHGDYGKAEALFLIDKIKQIMRG
jgi:cysteine desulfurase